MIAHGLAVSSGLRAAVVALPLAVLPGLRAPYEQPKVWWLQVIVVGTALAFILERAQHGGPPSTADVDRPLIVLRWLLAAYALWWLLVTLTSLVPGQSLLGSFDRGFGLLTVLAAIALFPLAQSSCRTADLRQSLIDAALVGSVPVCLLALGQVIGWDRLPPTYGSLTTALRVHSTLGQHLFLGSYLTLLVPLAAVRCLFAAPTRVPYGTLGTGAVWVAGVLVLVQLAASIPLGWLLLPLWGVAAAVAWDRVRGAAGSEPVRGIPAAALSGALLALQVVVVFLSGGRGPFLGLIVALALIGVMIRWRRCATAAPAAAKGALTVLVCVGVVLAAVGWRVGSLQTVPITGRLAMPSGSEPRESVDDRLELWGAVAGNLGRQLAGTEIIPGQSPRLRSVVGYGLDTQGFLLDRLLTERRGAQFGALGVRIAYDRAHDVLLDHIATGGLVAVSIWIALLVSVLVAGARRLRTDADLDWTLRLGCFGAVVGHVVEGITGIETIVPLALFWILAALLTAPPFRPAGEPGRRARHAAALWGIGLVVAAAIGSVAVTVTTVWLLGSMSYARGVALARIGRLADARVQLERATRLVPWLPSPRSMAGEAALRVAELEPDPVRRAAVMRHAEKLLATAHGGTEVSADVWLVRGRVALARARDGEPEQLAVALAALARADRLRPNDIRILSPWAVSLLTDGQPAQARALAERIVRMDDEDWLAWAVVARASARLGDQQREQEAEAQARRVVPREGRPFLDELR